MAKVPLISMQLKFDLFLLYLGPSALCCRGYFWTQSNKSYFLWKLKDIVWMSHAWCLLKVLIGQGPETLVES